jgi:hypothetical protein
MTSVATSVGESVAPIQEAFDVKDAAHFADPFETRGERFSPAPAEDEGSFSERRVAIVEAQGLHAMGELAAALGYIWVRLDAPGPQHRGRLGLYIEEAIEQQLEKRGALPPGIQASTGLDASLSDQLYRARFVEMRGIALGIPSLEGITNLGRALDAEDSAVLRWWIAAAADRPVQLVISSENTKLRVYPSPVLFETLFEVAPEPVTPLPPSPAMAASSEAMDLSDLPPEVELTNVLGTIVASVEDCQGAQSLFGGSPDDTDDEDLEDDVDLPELDRALGLAPFRETVPSTKKTLGKLRVDESPQLPLAYEGPAVDLNSTLSDGTRVFGEMLNEAREARAPGAQATEVETAQAAQVPRSESLSASDLADIDEEEFLKTLEMDSARAPSVDEDTIDEDSDFDQAVDEADGETAYHEATHHEATHEAAAGESEADDEEEPVTIPNERPRFTSEKTLESEAPAPPPLSEKFSEPLPTKKIARSPFIRLANPTEAVSDAREDDQAAAQAGESERSFASNLEPKSEPKLHVETSKVHVSETMTLAGAAAPDPNDPFNQLASREWKTWVQNLEAARGPKPLSVIERMFVTDYTRLREAVRRGVAAPSANAILDEWQASFSKSYAQAFDALRARGKRPTMVLDIVEMAARLGRLQGAKRVQLLMVDGLRFDLGLMVQDRMRQTVDASLAERLLLWSALPSVTQYQLELLGKGPDGLKEPGVSDEPPALVARGAAARVPRRVRTGRIELFKLDVVEDCLREVGAPVLERMDSIADQTAAAISDYLSKQPPRTMVVAFGDHGFSLDPKKAGTTEEVLQGGSSPEEVLVPAFAWLTGAVH